MSRLGTVYYKPETTKKEVSFDIYDRMSPNDAQDELSENIDKLDARDRNTKLSMEENLWLLRLSSESQMGVLVIESRRFIYSKNDWEKSTVALRLTQNGWQDYATSYNPNDVLPITKENVNTHLTELKDILQEKKFYLKNMVYPELKWELRNKQMEGLPDGHRFKVILPCPEKDKGILRRSDIQQENNMSAEQRGFQPTRREKPLPVMIPALPNFGYYKSALQNLKPAPEPTMESCKEDFFKHYNERKKTDYFGGLRNYNLPDGADLEKILSHAQEKNNRTRSICIKLGWLDDSGQLHKQAPKCVEKAFEDMKTNQSFNVPGGS